MDIFHAILNHSPQLLQPFVPAHTRYRVSLDEHVATSQEFQRLQRAPVWAQNSLSTLRKLGAIPDHAIDLDDIHRHVVLQDLDGLRDGHGPSQQADQIARFEDHARIVSLPRGLDRHGAVDQIQLAGDEQLLERPRHERPRLAQVRLAVLGKLHLEVRLDLERSALGILRLELFNLSRTIPREHCGI